MRRWRTYPHTIPGAFPPPHHTTTLHHTTHTTLHTLFFVARHIHYVPHPAFTTHRSIHICCVVDRYLGTVYTCIEFTVTLIYVTLMVFDTVAYLLTFDFRYELFGCCYEFGDTISRSLLPRLRYSVLTPICW